MRIEVFEGFVEKLRKKFEFWRKKKKKDGGGNKGGVK
jgi:hypothetical protein